MVKRKSKTSASQKLAERTWRERKISSGYRWMSAFIPESKVSLFKELLRSWSDEHEDKIKNDNNK